MDVLVSTSEVQAGRQDAPLSNAAPIRSV